MNTEKKLSLYIHIPFCLSKCEYCDFFSSVLPCGKEAGQKIIPDLYVEALCNEIIFRVKEYDPQSLRSVYIGGGTPSLLDGNQINKICNTILSLKQSFSSKKGVQTQTQLQIQPFEFTMEVNPDDVTEDFLDCLEKNGINRISCGIQSLSDSCLKFVNRRAKRAENLKAMELISRKWKGKKSFDLICGLPDETEESFREALDVVMSYNPEHISMYSLTIEEETALGRKCSSGQLEYDFNFADELWLSAKDYLEKNNYHQYEVSNFCKSGNECVHNLVYWNHEDYIGCGSGATGTLYAADGSGFRWTNTKDIKKYIEFWTDVSSNCKLGFNLNVCTDEFMGVCKDVCSIENVDLEASVFEYFMMGLRKSIGISEKDFYARFKKNIPAQIVELFEKYQKKGLADILSLEDDKRYFLTKEGLLFLNRFLEEIN